MTLQSGISRPSIPGPSPTPFGGPSAWHGDELGSCGQWQFEWRQDQIAEVLSAAEAAVESDVSLADVNARNFPLPRTSPLLSRIRQELEHGRGIARIRGFPVTQIDDAILRHAWMGICVHLGQPVAQDWHGQLLRRICDEGGGVGKRYGQLQDHNTGENFLSSKARTASTGPLRFHTDRTDVVGLLCTGVPASGGLSRVASSVLVHDQMLLRRPELASILYQPIWRSRLGEERNGERKPYPLPVFGEREGRFTSHYSRTYVEAAQLDEGIPRMTDSQWEALDLLAELAQEVCIESQFEPGDIQLLNSHVTYHARDNYVDDAPSGRVRSLLRIWLCAAPEHRPLPGDHEVLWRAVESGRIRGGIAVSE